MTSPFYTHTARLFDKSNVLAIVLHLVHCSKRENKRVENLGIEHKTFSSYE